MFRWSPTPFVNGVMGSASTQILLKTGEQSLSPYVSFRQLARVMRCCNICEFVWVQTAPVCQPPQRVLKLHWPCSLISLFMHLFGSTDVRSGRLIQKEQRA
jgi:hypothetical protein